VRALTTSDVTLMHLTVEPPLSQWSLDTHHYTARTELTALANRAAEHLGSAPLEQTPKLVMTGHQAALWHPGILAKDLVMAAAARRLGAGMCHLIVDQDLHETMQLDLPIVQDGRLSIESIQLAPVDAAIPTGCQPPVETGFAIEQLTQARRRLGSSLAVDVQPLLDVLSDLPTCASLAEQVAAITERLIRPWIGPMPLVFASQLLTLAPAATLVEQMLAQALRCVQSYNRAAEQHPQARIAPLAIKPDRIELPLWHLRFGKPRLRVYAAMTEPDKPMLVDETGSPINRMQQLAPRALLMTALLRSQCCDLFIHGTGGWVYDRVTEQWWRHWRGEELAPMALATADLYLQFDAPAGGSAELARAIWWAHHLPHNIDRHVGGLSAAERKLAEQKLRIIEGMHADADRVRRARDFAHLHQINDALVNAHRKVVAQSQHALRDARKGLSNQRMAHRRDWCFALYPQQDLSELAAAVARA
jgi:hypothetical protein